MFRFQRLPVEPTQAPPALPDAKAPGAEGDTEECNFAVGPASWQLTFDTLNHGVVRGLRHEVPAALVTHVGGTCTLTAPGGIRVLYIDHVLAQ